MSIHVSSVFQAMERICPSVAHDLQMNWSHKLSDYIDQVWKSPPSCQSAISITARQTFYSALRRFPLLQKIDHDTAIAEFDNAPILQTGPHCQLFVNDIDFNALLFSWMGSRHHNLNYTFILNSATRTLQWSKSCGPAWLNLSSSSINLFGMSPKKMSKMSVCAPSTPITYRKELIENNLSQIAQEEQEGLIKLFSVINPTPYPNMISAFTSPNLELINKCDIKGEVSPIILNDYFTSYVVAEHLQQTDGIIYKLLFTEQKRIKLNSLIEGLKNTPERTFLKESTQYFWGMRDNKIRALIIYNGFLLEEINDEEKKIKIPFNPEAIYSALYEGRLIPNIFLSFIVLSLMPQIRVIGGTRQIAYFPLIQHLLCELLDKHIPVEDDLREELQTNKLNTWGTYLIRHTLTPLQWLGKLPAGNELASLSDYYLNQPLSDVTQQLAIFKDHPKWKHFIQ